MNSAYLSNSSTPHQDGFTLIEVLVVLFILVLIGTMMAQAIVDAGKLRLTLTQETEFANELRTSLQVIERDVSQSFNPRWILPSRLQPLDPYNPPQPSQGNENKNSDLIPATIEEINNRTRGEAFKTTEYWGPVLAPSGIRAARFLGDENSFSFISASHVKVYKEKKESIYAKIKYFLNKDQLIKRVNTRAFDLNDPKILSQDTPYLQDYTLLTQILSLKFSYYSKKNAGFVKTWDSESQELKWQYPESIEMTFTLKGPGGKEVTQTVDLKMEAPEDALPQTY